MSARTYRPDDSNMGARVFWLEQVSEAAKVLSRSRVPNQFSGNKGASKISFEPEPSVVRGPAFDLDAPHARSHFRSRTMTRDEMRLAGYPDSVPEINVCASGQ